MAEAQGFELARQRRREMCRNLDREGSADDGPEISRVEISGHGR